MYIEGWGREGDTAVVAQSGDGSFIGAAWYRLFAGTAAGYGFVDATVPEVTLAVQPDWRRRGIGRSLLTALHEEARAAAITRLSLSVEPDNPARHLYEAMGYRKLAGTGGAWTMVTVLP